jgi:shingomyelin synthase
MFVTVLPVASKTYECKEKANVTTVALVAQRTFDLLLGLGLSVNGHHKYCGDYIYSGHTMILVFGALVVGECKFVDPYPHPRFCCLILIFFLIP